jgi:methylglutaconyl-CoA hydratase
MSELVRSEAAGAIATITLDSPANRNALSSGLLSELREALEGALGDDGARVIVLTGAGPVFCSGADLTETRVSPGAAPALFASILQMIWDSAKPVIGRVNGTARAGGLGLIAACDIAVAPQSATFAFSEVRVGATPATIAVTCLRRMEPRAAAEYFLTGEAFGAPRAAEIGLLTRAVPDADLDRETRRCAGLLLRGAPGALAATKTVLREAAAVPVAEGLAAMARLSAERFASPEAREGLAAFAEKRDPNWVALPGGGDIPRDRG